MNFPSQKRVRTGPAPALSRSFPAPRRRLLGACVLWYAAITAVRADDWPQWRGPLRDGVWREADIVAKLPEAPRYRWKQTIGNGYAGPAVAGGRVFVMDRVLLEGEKNPDNPFDRSPVRGVERVLALDGGTGDILWKHTYPCRYTISYPSGPRVTPTVHDQRVYSVGAMGDLFCLHPETGDVLWSRNYPRDFGTEINTWGMAAAPLVDGERLILLAGGRPGACVVALDRKTGRELWRALDVEDPGYSPPVIFEAGGTRQLIVWTPRFLASLDPATGEEHWREPLQVNSGLSIATPIFDPTTHRLLVTSFYNGPVMMQLERDRPAAEVLWRGKSDSERKTDILHGLMCTPIFRGRHIYGVGSYGQLRCVEAATGKRIWETFEATGHARWWNAFLIPHGDRVFISNEQGELIIARLEPGGYRELGRMKVIEPTNPVLRRTVVWSHPAFADGAMFLRNDGQIVCVDLRAR